MSATPKVLAGWSSKGNAKAGAGLPMKGDGTSRGLSPRPMPSTTASITKATSGMKRRTVPLTVENSQSLFTASYGAGETVNIPVAHHDGNYFADAATLDRIEGEGRVAFRYADAVNGSARGIAGVLNDAGNVLGMMPHPERAIDRAHGGTDGLRLFEAALGVLA